MITYLSRFRYVFNLQLNLRLWTLHFAIKWKVCKFSIFPLFINFVPFAGTSGTWSLHNWRTYRVLRNNSSVLDLSHPGQQSNAPKAIIQQLLVTWMVVHVFPIFWKKYPWPRSASIRLPHFVAKTLLQQTPESRKLTRCCFTILKTIRGWFVWRNSEDNWNYFIVLFTQKQMPQKNFVNRIKFSNGKWEISLIYFHFTTWKMRKNLFLIFFLFKKKKCRNYIFDWDLLK